MTEKFFSLEPINGCTCDCYVETYEDTSTVYYGFVQLVNSESCADISSYSLDGLKEKFRLIVELDAQTAKLNETLILEQENWTGEIVACLIDGVVLGVFKDDWCNGEFFIPVEVLNHIQTYFKTIVSLLEVGITIYGD